MKLCVSVWLCVCVLLTYGLRNSYEEHLSREMFVIEMKDYGAVRTVHIVGLFVPSVLREKVTHGCWDLKKKLWRRECKARPSGWLGKRVTGGDFPFLSYCFTDPYSHLFLACIGFGLSLRQEPAADVTILPVKTTMKALHTTMYVTDQTYRKCAFPFYNSPSASH